MRLQHFQPIRNRANDDNADFATGQILLKFEFCIDGHEDCERCFSEFEKFAVLCSGPAGFLHRSAIVAVCDQEGLERTRRALVDQYSH